MQSNICGLLLAAGSATRFGEQKLLYPLSTGENILTRSARTLKMAIPHCVAVVQNDTDEVSEILTYQGFELVVNPNPEKGIGSSIQCGISNSIADAWVIALADMPFVQLETINKIIGYLKNGEKIVAPFYKQQRGHPVGFSSIYKNQLIKLKDDVGAKNILKNNKNDLKGFETDDSGVRQDIDRKEDVELYSVR